MDYRENAVENLKKPVFWMGSALVAAGGAVLIYLAVVCVQIINNPGEVELVKWLLASTEETGLIASGHINNNAFEIRLSDALQYLFLGVIGLTMVSILASVVSALISGGIKLVLYGQQEAQAQNATAQSNKRVYPTHKS